MTTPSAEARDLAEELVPIAYDILGSIDPGKRKMMWDRLIEAVEEGIAAAYRRGMQEGEANEPARNRAAAAVALLAGKALRENPDIRALFPELWEALIDHAESRDPPRSFSAIAPPQEGSP